MGHQHAISKYMEHGDCFLWEPGLVWLHVLSDIVTGIAYYSIPVALFYFAYKRRDLPFHNVFLLFGVFILACGTTHFLAAYTVFVAEYWVEGGVKAFTAVISAVSAFYLIPLIPKAIALPNLTKSLEENKELNAKLEKKLNELNAKTRELMETNRELNLAEVELKKSEETFRSLVNNIPGIVYRGHRDWSLSFIGAEVEQVTGYTSDEFTGGAVGWKGIIHPEDLERIKEAFRKAEKEKSGTLRVEYRIRHKDGGIRWIEDRRQLMYEEGGAFVSVDGLLLDVTDRVEFGRRLQEGEVRFRAIADTASDGIVTVDAQGGIVFFNPAAERTFGHTFADVAGKNVAMLIPERYRSAHQGGMDRFLKTGEPRVIGKTVELEGLRKDGTEFPIELSLATWESKGDTVFSAIIRDITERKKRERALKESEEQLRIIFEGSKDGILLADVETRRFIAGNRAICDMLQYTLDEIRQLSVTEIHPEEDLPRILEEFERQARQESGMGRDIPVKRKDGSILFVDIKTSPVTISGRSYLMGNFRNVTERRKREEELTRLHLAIDQAAEAVIITDFEGTIEYVNPAFERITGYSREEAVGQNPRVLKSGKQDEAFYRTLWETLLRGEVWKGRFVNRRKDGSLYDEESTISSVRNASGKIINFVAAKRDITREVELQRQFQTVQRMESVGALAGGIAHDFNNALTGIFGFGEMLRLKVADRPEALKDLDTIAQCAQQAATLTRQLLTFARRQVIDPVNLDLNVVVTEMEKLVRKVVGEHIEVKTFLAKGLPTARLDRSQVEQVLMNLCLNARDAMPSGGQLLLETADVTTDDEYVEAHPYVTSGRYVLLTVSDTGTGMDPETVEKVFEPFFTTKEVGKGTGLGLSSVYGIVKQSGGFVHVYSEPGKGSFFKVYFPAVDAPPDAVSGKPGKETVRGGTETILLAEDEESLRGLAVRVLEGLGYTVLVARDGEEAVSIFRENPGVSLVLLDVVMPGKGGKEAYEEMRKGNPNLKGVFMSGYSANAVHESFVLTPGIPFLTKPYTISALGRKVREVLDKA